jgi:hypothetical protein
MNSGPQAEEDAVSAGADFCGFGGETRRVVRTAMRLKTNAAHLDGSRDHSAFIERRMHRATSLSSDWRF